MVNDNGECLIMVNNAATERDPEQVAEGRRVRSGRGCVCVGGGCAADDRLRLTLG